jgi:hypothetical protein
MPAPQDDPGRRPISSDPTRADAADAVIETAPPLASDGRAFGWPVHAATALLSLLALLVCVALLPFALYTFWVFCAAAASIWDVPVGAGLLAPRLGLPGGGWPLDAATAAGIVFSAGLSTLLQDRIALVGNGRARAVLLRKTRALLGNAVVEGTSRRFFVEAHVERSGGGARSPSGSDAGWLVLAPDSLFFVGDRLRVTLPRASVARVEGGRAQGRWPVGGDPRPKVCFMSGSSDGAPGVLRFRSRDARHVSELGPATREIAEALTVWHTAAA